MTSHFLTLCQRRRSIRQYSQQEVSREQLETILQCALMSPSSKRLNPWEFYVIRNDKLRNDELIKALAGCKTYGSQMFETAMAAIVVAVDSALTDTWQADAAIAAQNILLAAEDIGLGACWCQILERDNSEQMVRELCNIPQNLRVLCAISIGYKDEERKCYDLDKLKYEKIHWI